MNDSQKASCKKSILVQGSCTTYLEILADLRSGPHTSCTCVFLSFSFPSLALSLSLRCGGILIFSRIPSFCSSEEASNRGTYLTSDSGLASSDFNWTIKPCVIPSHRSFLFPWSTFRGETLLSKSAFIFPEGLLSLSTSSVPFCRGNISDPPFISWDLLILSHWTSSQFPSVWFSLPSSTPSILRQHLSSGSSLGLSLNWGSEKLLGNMLYLSEVPGSWSHLEDCFASGTAVVAEPISAWSSTATFFTRTDWCLMWPSCSWTMIGWRSKQGTLWSCCVLTGTIWQSNELRMTPTCPTRPLALSLFDKSRGAGLLLVNSWGAWPRGFRFELMTSPAGLPLVTLGLQTIIRLLFRWLMG